MLITFRIESVKVVFPQHAHGQRRRPNIGLQQMFGVHLVLNMRSIQVYWLYNWQQSGSHTNIIMFGSRLYQQKKKERCQ